MNQKSNGTQQNGARLVVRSLEAQGMTHVYGIPGAKIDAVFEALVDTKSSDSIRRTEFRRFQIISRSFTPTIDQSWRRPWRR
jgi:hypothetical protein